MVFYLYPLRFELAAREEVRFPPRKAANVLRGGLGVVLRQIACIEDCAGPQNCGLREKCAYAQIFEPSATDARVSGLADRPRPFVFRARHLDGRTIAPGDGFHFDLNLFSLDGNHLVCLVRAFATLAAQGFGPRRGKAQLLRVISQQRPDQSAFIVYAENDQRICLPPSPVRLDLSPARPVTRVRIDFLSPIELKSEDRIAARPEFPVLFGRVRDRIATLSRLYGAGPLDIDYEGTNARARNVEMTRCQVERQEIERRSSRTGEIHPIGGLTGSAEYQGDLTEFVPFLNAAQWTGVGRQAVWGKGEIVTTVLA